MKQTFIEEKIAMIGNVMPGLDVDKFDINKGVAMEVKIESRFGPLIVQTDKAICFPNGMPGVPGISYFVITEVPNVKHGHFRLFQSLNNHSLSFIVIPGAYETLLIEKHDIDEACSVLGIVPANLLLLFLVTSHGTGAERRLSVNAKAPVFIDVSTKNATQYVFQNNHYEIQHFIS